METKNNKTRKLIDRTGNDNYYIGLDIGTDSVGWALTDSKYNLQKINNKSTWGVRLFDGAATAKDRRTKRCLRRRLRRRKVRLNYLKSLFAPAINKIDPMFLKRLANSYLYVNEDGTTGTRIDFAQKNNIQLYQKNKRLHLFEGLGITDKEFYSDFPTIYHLRKALLDGKITKIFKDENGNFNTVTFSPHYDLYDPRLVFLALYSLLKTRGHFLYDADINSYLEGKDLKDKINAIAEGLLLKIDNEVDYENVKKLYQNELIGIKDEKQYKIKTKNDKFKKIKELIKVSDKADESLNLDNKERERLFYDILSLSFGGTTTLKKPKNESESLLAGLENEVKIDFSKQDLDAIDQLIAHIDEGVIESINASFFIFNWSKLNEVLSEEKYICCGKVKTYEKHKKDLMWLKNTVREILKNDSEKEEKYNMVFGGIEKGFTYEAYVHHGVKSTKDTRLKSFISHIEKVLGDEFNCKINENNEIKYDIDDDQFLPIERSLDNSSIPNAVIKYEYEEILKKAVENGVDFLTKDDESKYKNDSSGKTPYDKILSLISFKIPYYVGPLAYNDSQNDQSINSWIVRKPGWENKQIMPWVFDDAVDKGKTRTKFIERMSSSCTYLRNEKALPKKSIYYQKMEVLEELNNMCKNLQIDVNNLDENDAVKIKQYIFHEIFEQGISPTKTKIERVIKKYYRDNFGRDVSVDFKLGGEDSSTFKSSLSSYLALKDIPITDEQKEELIALYTIFGQETKIAKEEAEKKDWYKKLSETDKDRINKSLSKVSGWGRYSKEFLTGITAKEKSTGCYKSILTYLYETNYNIQSLLFENKISEPFGDKVREFNKEKSEKKTIYNVKYEDLDCLYVPVNVKRAVWQSIKIVKELVNAIGCSPRKIFIETTRNDDKKNEVIKSRYKQIHDLYEAVKNQADELKKDLAELKTELEVNKDKLSSERLFLYFTQFGQDMYTGDSIDIKAVLNGTGYDVDHIYPRSITADDSILDNKVLVDKELNGKKGNKTLKSSGIIKDAKNVTDLWKLLLEKNPKSKEKFRRLKYSLNNDELEDKEIENFANRQLVETSQSTKAVKDMLNNLLNSEDNNATKTEIVYSKAGKVTDFRNINRLYKNRDINDMHHAKDAYLNIVVGNVYNAVFTHGYWKNLVKHISDEDQKGSKSIHDGIFRWSEIKDGKEVVWENEKTLALVEKNLYQNDVLLTRMQTTGKGALFDETVYSAKGQTEKLGVTPVKNNDLHYGYYNKQSSAYFCLVSYKAKKDKTEYSIECIPLWFYNKNKQLSKKDIAKQYCELDQNDGGLGLKNVQVIKPYLRIKTLLKYAEDNGYMAGYLSGRTGNNLKFYIADMLKLEAFEPYAIQVCKFVEKRKENKEYTIEQFNYRKQLETEKHIKLRAIRRPVITDKDNISLYDYLIEVHKKSCFINKPSSQIGLFEKNREKFISLSLEDQVILLYNMIAYFNGDLGNFSLIGGSNNAGVFLKGKKIPAGSLIINQSITGLFENSFTIKE